MLLGIFLFSSCGSLPRKPSIDICSHDAPSFEVECYNNQTGNFKTIPIEKTDKFIMFSPDDWGLVLLYIGKLERRLRSNKKNGVEQLIAIELEKIKSTSDLLY
jgi:hypothetical protein